MARHYIFGQIIQKDLTKKDIAEIINKAKEKKAILSEYPLIKIIRLLSKLREKWVQENYYYRQKTLQLMPSQLAYSKEMVLEGIKVLLNLLKAEYNFKKLDLEIGNRHYLDNWVYKKKFNGYLRAFPLGILLHISAGNVFIGAIDSLINGFLTKNINILKTSSDDPTFPILFAQSLKDIDTEGILSNSFAILSFPGGSKDIETKLAKNADGIVIWGGKAVVNYYRSIANISTRLIEYGPKYSFTILTEVGIRDYISLKEITDKIAKDIIMWEQKSCSSPHVIYLQKGKYNYLQPFLESLKDSLHHLSLKYPVNHKDMPLDEKVDLRRIRENAIFSQTYTNTKVLFSKKTLDYTIIYEDNLDFKVSPLSRTIYVKEFKDIDEVIEKLKPFGYYFQSVGILASPKEYQSIATKLSNIGATRFTVIGKMSKAKIGAPHEGGFQLERLLKWVDIEQKRKREYISIEEDYEYESEYVFDKIKDLVEYAKRKSPYYKQKFANIEIKTFKDFYKLPLLTKEDLYTYGPPKSYDILTSIPKSAYIFSSGGTTGKPKYGLYYYDEMKYATDIMSNIYQIAGIKQGDIVANLFFAGNMWTSFIVVNKALEEIGCINLPISGNAEIENIAKYLIEFKANVLIGLPSMLIRLAEYIYEKRLTTHIERILYGGEHLTLDSRVYLKKVFGGKLEIISAGYASVDAGPIGFQCAYQKGGLHHVISNYQFIEIISPETGEKLPFDTWGEIVVTNLGRFLMPIIRYKTGDRGRLLSKKCLCSRQAPVLELGGRLDDIIRIGTADISINYVDSIISEFEQLSHNFQIIAEKRIKDILIIKAEKISDIINEQDFKNIFLDKFINENYEIKEALEKGWIEKIELNLVNKGQIKANKRTGKIKRIIDNRV